MAYVHYVLTGLAAVAVTGWLVLLSVSARATRTPPVREQPATSRLRPESPALVDLLTGGWRLCDREAASATLLDLAARGFVDIEETGDGPAMVRLRAEDHMPGRLADLTPYERMVYDHVSGLAADGAVPAGALAEGPRHLKSWWRRFERHVVAESTAHGLTRPRWSKSERFRLWATTSVPTVAVALLFVFLPEDGPRLGNGLGPGAAVWIALTVLVHLLNREQGTPAGAEAAGHWLGVRAHLATGTGYGDTPAAGAGTWGRELAYAAALGLAGRAVADLPVSRPADDRKAWSDYGGSWHVVRVRYPGVRLPAGHHLRLIRGRGWFGMATLALCVGLVSFQLTWAVLLSRGPYGEMMSRAPRIAVVIAVLAAAVPLLYTLVDRSLRVTVEGQVVRARRYETLGRAAGHSKKYSHWVAVDDGRSRVTTAYAVDDATFAQVAEGDVVRLRVGPLLRRATLA